MMPAALPLTPVASSSGAANGPLTPVKADESAARDFAAILGTMLPAQPSAPTQMKKIELDAVADATITDEATGETPDESVVIAAGGILEAPAENAMHAHGTRTASPSIAANGEATRSTEASTEKEAVSPSSARGSRATRSGRPMRPTEAAVERRRAIAAANAAARSIMGDALAATSAALNGSDAIAAAAPRAAAPNAVASTGEVILSTAMLDQDFSARLDRVIARMEEAGHTVEVRETLRTPERQQALYAQGRTSTGPVVTWTLDSKHLDGKAADVRVDGRSSGPAYDLLHAIAGEEGLRTLGAKDPGHLELARTTADAREGAAARRGAGFGGASDGADMIRATVIRPGGIAQVARVADVAPVAQVAHVAQAGAPGLLTTASARARDVASDRALGVAAARWRSAGLPAMRGTATTTTASAAAPTTAATLLGPDATSLANIERDFVGATVPADESQADVQTDAKTGAQSAAPRTADNGRGIVPSGYRATEAERDAVAREAEVVRGSRRAPAGPAGAPAQDGAPRVGGESLRELTAVHGTRHGAAPITPAGSLAAERVAELLAARDAQPAGIIGELRLAMDPTRDGLNEVRLAMQNGALDASLRTSDAGVARGLAAEVSTLTRSLERQGFEGARVAVHLENAQQARATALETVAASEATARERGLRGDSDASREGRDQQAPHHSAHDTRRDQQHARQFASRRQRSF